MIVEIGHYALVMALFVAVAQATLPILGARRNHAPWMEFARTAALGQFFLIAVAFGALIYAFAVSDFSVLNVFENSHTDKPMLYKISGVWGNHEGSLLLWIVILSLFGAILAVGGRNLPPSLRALALAVQGMIGVGFLIFVLLTSNPFTRVSPVPMNGNGLNPLLQDPGLAFHPPFLYLGYVGFSMAFSFAIAALIEGKVDAAWARWVRPWTLAAWVFLTLGIALGSWWAYYELGWGGYWYWDPVENASFMPWLVGTALLHSAIVVEKRSALKTWTILLAIVTFSFSLLGTFLVRSGVITSVHSFVSDPARGLFILGLLVLTIGCSLTLFAIRAPGLRGGGLFAPISREGSLLLNNMLMAAGTGTVLVGTLYPLIADVFGLGEVSVGPPFFNAVFLPLMVPMVVVMVLGPMLAWKRGDLPGALWRLKLAGLMTVFVLIAAFVIGGGEIGLLWTALGLGLAAWLFFGALVEFGERIKLFAASLSESLRRARTLPRSAWGMTLAHAGMALIIGGITGSAAWQSESIQAQRIGETVDVAGHAFTLTAVEEGSGANYTYLRGTFEVRRNGDLVTVLRPEKRTYLQPPRPTTESAIHSTWTGDLYAVIGDRDASGAYVTRLYGKPLVPWLWAGSLLMALGGVVSLTDRRLRIGVPARARVAARPLPAE